MKIGVFDSGYGGLTILEQIRKQLPEYDYLYLGDNARAPYGTHSFEVIHQYTWQAVQYLFGADCSLVILACNTASAKALRTIQQQDIPQWLQLSNCKLSNCQIRNGQLSNSKLSNSQIRNVLGVIRPTTEAVAQRTRNGHIGVLGTPGTVQSGSYAIELQKQRADLLVAQQACPMWVPLIENGEHLQAGADYFVEKYLRLLFAQDPQIDTLVLGCTHYPLLLPKIQAALSAIVAHEVEVVAQGEIVARSLQDYLRRHTDIAATLSQGATCTYLTTEQADKFSESASLFLRTPVNAHHVVL
ncbi:MAG: aspartate/glutamate racemase family protein [Paludibacteraceae bacterium]|nr:aspartate/glutamate racemase family protein [Paludibacteraceae bacterium]